MLNTKTYSLTPVALESAIPFLSISSNLFLLVFLNLNVTSHTPFSLSVSATKILKLFSKPAVAGYFIYFIPWGSDLYRSFSAAVAHRSFHQLQLCSSSERLHSLDTLTPLWPVCVCVCELYSYLTYSSPPLLLLFLASCLSPCNLPLCVLIFAVWPSPPLFALLLLGLAEGERRGQERSVGEWVDNLQ